MSRKRYYYYYYYPCEIFHAVKIESQVAKIVLVNPGAKLNGIWHHRLHHTDGADDGEVLSQDI